MQYNSSVRKYYYLYLNSLIKYLIFVSRILCKILMQNTGNKKANNIKKLFWKTVFANPVIKAITAVVVVQVVPLDKVCRARVWWRGQSSVRVC